MNASLPARLSEMDHDDARISLPELLESAGIPIRRKLLGELSQRAATLEVDGAIQRMAEALVTWRTKVGDSPLIEINCESQPLLQAMSQRMILIDVQQVRASAERHVLLAAVSALERMTWILAPEMEDVLARTLARSLRRSNVQRTFELEAKQMASLFDELWQALQPIAPDSLHDAPPAQLAIYLRAALRQWRAESAEALPALATLRVLASLAGQPRPGNARIVCTVDGHQCQVMWEPFDVPGSDRATSSDWVKQRLATVPWSRGEAKVVDLRFSVAGSELVIDDVTPAEESLIEFMARGGALGRGELKARLKQTPAAELMSAVTGGMHPRIKGDQKPLATGIGGQTGIISGRVCTTREAIAALKRGADKVIYCATAPDPALMSVLALADGFIFARGGATSHFAVVARGMGKPCIMATRPAIVTDASGVVFAHHHIANGSWLTVDGIEGLIYEGRLATAAPVADLHDFSSFLSACDASSGIEVLVNADDAGEVGVALAGGAKGVGLCRIEHLLLRPPLFEQFASVLIEMLLSIDTVRDLLKMDLLGRVWAQTDFPAQLAARRGKTKSAPHYAAFQSALFQLEQALKGEFVRMIGAAQGQPVAVRLLDPPIGEFISRADVSRHVTANRISEKEAEELGRWIDESHSMLGLRGVRFALSFPELCRMQVRAAVTAADEVARDRGNRQKLGIILPFVVDVAEIIVWRELILREVDMSATPACQLEIGAMLETPRAILTAGAIAAQVDFLAFGTNDLSQLTWAAGRDDGSGFLESPVYGWAGGRPFTAFDTAGVGRLLAMAAQAAREANPSIRLGICGEHAAMLDAAPFFVEQGFHYLSCAAAMVPAVRAGAARAAAIISR